MECVRVIQGFDLRCNIVFCLFDFFKEGKWERKKFVGLEVRLNAVLTFTQNLPL